MEPARKQDHDIEPDIRPDLRVIDGGGETTPDRPAKGNLRAVDNSEIVDAEQKGTFDDSQSEDIDEDKVRASERVGDAVRRIPSSYTGGNKNSTTNKVRIWRNIGIFGGAGGIIGALLFILSGFLPLGGLLLNLGETATANRDAQNSMLTKRLYATIDSKISNASDDGACDTNKAACRFTRPSNALLSRLNDYGIVAYDGDTALEKKDTGFPERKPSTYQFTRSTGQVVTVAAADFTKTIQADIEFGKKFNQAFNMRYWGYADSYIKKLFYRNYDIDRTGTTTNNLDPDDPQKSIKAIADGDGDNKVKTATSDEAKNAAARELINEAIEDEVDTATKRFARSGSDPVVLAGTLGCTAINAPGFFTKVARLYQMRQEILLASSIVLTASSMLKAGEMSPETMAIIGTLLTASVVSSDGTNSGSAMDSFGIKSILFGDSSSSDSSWKKFIPGYSAMTATKGITQFAQTAEVKAACDIIWSPQAQIGSATVTAIIGAASGGIGAVGIAVLRVLGAGTVAIVGADAIADIVGGAVTSLFSLVPEETIASVLGNEDISNAQNKDFGEVLGGGISFFYSNAGLSTTGSALSTSQLASFNELQQDTMIAYAEQDRFGRSPLDVSSPYTFLGSIVSNYYKFAYTPNNTFKTIVSSVGYTLSQPFKILNTPTYAQATDYTKLYSHAAEFGVDPKVAIGPYGEMAPGIAPEFMNASTSAVMSSVSDQIDENSGEWREDSEIQDILTDCGNNDLLKAAVCVTEDQNRANKSIYPIDLRLNDMLDGVNTDVDEPEVAPSTGGGTNTGRPAGAIDAGSGWTMPNNGDFSAEPCDPRTEDLGPYTNTTYGFTVRLCRITLNSSGDSANGSDSVSSVISTNTMNMLEDARDAGHPIGISDAMRRTGAGSYSQHKYGLALDLGAPRGGNTICYGGDPRYGYGSLENARNACAARGGAHYEAYQWLNENAANYGFINYGVEPWHWSTSGM